MPAKEEIRQPTLWLVYTLFILAATASCSARIFSVLRDKETPFLSANDRSRWCTIRSLGDHGTYVIDDIIFDKDRKPIKPWHTIDLVKHRGADGREHYYSSKPVLMPTLMTGVYLAVKGITGKSLAADPFFVGRTVLWLCNVPPLVLMFYLLIKLIDRYAENDWARLVGAAAVAWGTFLTTFAIALNNHVHAAVCVTIAVYCFLEIVQEQRRTWLNFFWCGLFSALLFANELPGLAFLALMGAALLWIDWRRTLIAFVPPSVVVVVAMAVLNFVAHNTWRPAYAHRHDGPLVKEVTLKDVAALRNGDPSELIAALGNVARTSTLQPRLEVNPGDNVQDRWALWDVEQQLRLAVNLVDGSSGRVQVQAWDNWYEYDDTYWTVSKKKGVDLGEQSPAAYAFHVLIGHRGLFSLTPLWLFSAWGMLLWLRGNSPALRMVSGGALLLTVVCLAFYLSRPLQDRNYGGVCNGLRWMMWFIPLYLFTMLPALSAAAKTTWGRGLGMAALAVSIFSASYKPGNCFSHPWLYDLLEYLKVIHYG